MLLIIQNSEFRILNSTPLHNRQRQDLAAALFKSCDDRPDRPPRQFGGQRSISIAIADYPLGDCAEIGKSSGEVLGLKLRIGLVPVAVCSDF